MAIARRALHTRRVGHAGTLDPFATGLLLLLVGRATRLAPYLFSLPKAYEGRLRLGVTTDTDDCTGKTLATNDGWRDVDDAALRAHMAGLTGRQPQQPPQYSAKKVGGVRAYKRARRGEPVTLVSRDVDVGRFALVSRDGPDVVFLADVSSGTYVRSLARDLGVGLGCGAHLTELRRLSIGCYTVADAVSVQDLREGGATVRPMLDALRHLPRIAIDEAARAQVGHGQALDLPGDEAGPVALVAGDTLVAVAERDGTRLDPKVVLEP